MEYLNKTMIFCKFRRAGSVIADYINERIFNLLRFFNSENRTQIFIKFEKSVIIPLKYLFFFVKHINQNINTKMDHKAYLAVVETPQLDEHYNYYY